MVYHCPEKETVILQFSKQLHRGRANLTINFIGNLTAMMEIGSIKMQPEAQPFVSTDFGPIDARRSFPCWDEPRFKVKFDLYMIIPKHYTAISNMNSNRKRSYTNELDEVRFDTTPPIAPFQLTTLYGPKFVLSTNNATRSQKDGDAIIRVYSMVRVKREEFTFAMDTAEMLIKFYQYYFNQKYALEKLDMIAVKDNHQASIEKLGMIVFPIKHLSIANVTLATEEELRIVAESVGHSVAHQWLGNVVVFQQWKQFWLCEALASYMEREALDSLFPHWKSWETFAAKEMRFGLDLDASIHAKSLTNQINHPNDIMQYNSNENVYRKAVSLLRMLKLRLGDDTFVRAVQSFIANHTSTTASVDGLLQCFLEVIDYKEQPSKQIISKVFNDWISKDGFPVLHVEEQQKDEEVRVIKIRQERFVNVYKRNIKKDTTNKNVWPLPLSLIHSFDPFTISFQTVMMDESAEYTLNGIFEEEWIKLNPEFSNFYRVHYSEDMLTKFTISIEEKVLPPMDRLNLIDDLFAFIKAGYVQTDVGLRFMTSYENEDNPNVWAAIVSALCDLNILISNIDGTKASTEATSLKNKYWQYGQNLLFKMYRRLGWQSDTTLPQVGQRMKSENFAEQKLRENILCTMGKLKESNFTAEASAKYQDYINGQSYLTIGLLECVFRAFSSFPTSPSSAKLNQTFDHLFKVSPSLWNCFEK